jgi:hypothetical protein
MEILERDTKGVSVLFVSDARKLMTMTLYLLDSRLYAKSEVLVFIKRTGWDPRVL